LRNKLKIGFIIAICVSVIGGALYIHARTSDAYSTAVIFLKNDKNLENKLGKINDYSLDSFGYRYSNGIRVYYRFDVEGLMKESTVTIWLSKNDGKWEVFN